MTPEDKKRADIIERELVNINEILQAVKENRDIYFYTTRESNVWIPSEGSCYSGHMKRPILNLIKELASEHKIKLEKEFAAL